MQCEEADCDREAAFELHVPWTDNEYVCPGHARVRAREDGVVADALADAGDILPEGASELGGDAGQRGA